jgi:Cu(I)/Ag(I) efflux system membrane fusion protein
MHPEVVQDDPGRCPICEMPLERVPDLFPAQDIPPQQASADEGDSAGRVLAIRKSAVLDTGRRQVTYRKRKDGAYELVELSLGPLAQAEDDSGEIGSYYPVLDGLQPGDEVIVQGGFLLDSQRQIEGMPSLLYSEGRSAAGLHAAHGGPPPPSTSTPAPAEHKH